MSNRSNHHSMDHEHSVRGSEVFIGGLSHSTAENKIHEVFSTCGDIMEVRLIKDQKGNSKGFGFVRFAAKEAADKAVKEKSGILLDGKKIGVLPSNEQDSLYFGNLRKEWTADEFDKIVRQTFPDVVSVDLPKPFNFGDASQKQRNRGFAIVKFSSHAAAARAYRAGSKSDFLLAAGCHPAIDWAEEEPEVDPDELARVKIAFVRNLPEDADENYLRELFEPLGKLDKVVLSKKRRSPVGFVHFAERSDLDNALKEMSGKTVQGPNGGSSFKLLVEVARPMEKNRKRSHDDSQSRSAKRIPSHPKSSTDEQILSTSVGLSKAQGLQYSPEETVVTDPYEAAVVSLPVSVKERLLRILRLGIATRYDIDIQSLTSLKELPQSIAISILDQFMLSAADRSDKGEYLAGLISKQAVDKFAVNRHALSLARTDTVSKEPQLYSYSGRVHLPAVDPFPSRISATVARYDSLTSRYTSSISPQPLPLPSRTGFGRLEEDIPASLYRSSGSSSLSYGKLALDPPLPTAVNRNPAQPQVRFDPFTGQPYKFDPFTGEPILPDRGFRSPY